MRSVWLIVVRARALVDGARGFKEGSEVLAQCLVPEDSIFAALGEIPPLLAASSLEFREHIMAEKYRVDDPNQEYPGETVKRYLLDVAETAQPGFGLFFYSDEEAQTV